MLMATLSDDFQMGVLCVGCDKLQINRRGGGCCAVFAGEHQAFPSSPEVEIGVAEGVDVARPAEALAGGDLPAAFFRV